MNTIPYGKQHITDEDIEAVVNTLRSDFLTQGPAIEDFEQSFANYIGCKYAVAVSNGTAALHLAAIALGVDEKSHVITTPITFAASANCVRYCGGQVSFVDIDPSTATMDIKKLEALLKASPHGTYTGVVPVDFGGYPVPLEAIRKLADDYGLWVLEDACHAPGGFFIDQKGQKQHCGNGVYADAAIFSFHPVKHIACGEGGMITTNNEAIYKRLLLLRTHGITKDASLMNKNDGGWYYEMLELGYNYRLTDFQAALGLSQLSRAKQGLERRKEIAQRYDTAFAGTRLKLMDQPPGKGHAYHLYIIQTEDRKGLYDFLRSRKIFAQVHYIPVHTLPYYQALGFKPGDYPNAEAYYDRCLSLPMYPTLTDEEQNRVIASALEYSENNSGHPGKS
jgi:UDP-4-amino-4,6-dideoxy-N-acetyl-beta-L-altrosamine transaminase